MVIVKGHSFVDEYKSNAKYRDQDKKFSDVTGKILQAVLLAVHFIRLSLLYSSNGYDVHWSL